MGFAVGEVTISLGHETKPLALKALALKAPLGKLSPKDLGAKRLHWNSRCEINRFSGKAETSLRTEEEIYTHVCLYMPVCLYVYVQKACIRAATEPDTPAALSQ